VTTGLEVKFIKKLLTQTLMECAYPIIRVSMVTSSFFSIFFHSPKMDAVKNNIKKRPFLSVSEFKDYGTKSNKAACHSIDNGLN